jgi:hypothetical protein
MSQNIFVSGKTRAFFASGTIARASTTTVLHTDFLFLCVCCGVVMYVVEEGDFDTAAVYLRGDCADLDINWR